MAKTIIENSTLLSKYVFEDDVAIQLTDINIITPKFIVGDLNSGNSTLIENITSPADWYGNKYTYDVTKVGVEWAKNPNWADDLEPGDPADPADESDGE